MVNKNTTVADLAKKLANVVKPEVLIDSLKRLGIQVSNTKDIITYEQEKRLLELLKSDPKIIEVPPKISLKRRSSISQIKVKSASGVNATVNVVRKNRRVYVKDDLNSNQSKEDRTIIDTFGDQDTATVEQEIESSNKIENKQQIDDLAVAKKAHEIKTTNVTPDLIDGEEKSNNNSKSKKDKKDKKNKITPVVDDEEKIAKKQKAKVVKDKEKSIPNSKININLLSTNLDEDLEDELVDGIPKAVLSRKIRSSQKTTQKPNNVQKRNLHAFEKPVAPMKYQVELPFNISVLELAQRMSVKFSELIKFMNKMGITVTAEQMLDQDTACLVVEEMGHTAVLNNPRSLEDSIVINYNTVLETRPPIVTVMGHVDHGKTSLLDYIRSTRVTFKEAGGITQHIGAYQVALKDHGFITFLDTPGHSAFSAMRARGANCTDIIILVVAADDGVMPQTVEAIQHAKAAAVPIIVAINKMDKSEADPGKVTSQLVQYGITPEDWGGDNIFIKISAKTGLGVDQLLEAIMLQAEVLELKAPHVGPAQGVVIESSLDKLRGGVVATLLVQTGTLNKGDIILAGLEYGKVRSLKNDQGLSIDKAVPSMPVEVLGLSDAPLAGDKFQVLADEKIAREVVSFRNTAKKEESLSYMQELKITEFMNKMQQTENFKNINIVLKADVQGSVEAIANALEKLSTDEVKVNIIARSVGGFNESDVNLALASKAFLLGFNVRAEPQAKVLAKSQNKEFNYYSIIYDLIEAVKEAIKGNTAVALKEKIIGLAEVREVFKSSKFGTIAGCIVKEGIIKRGNKLRVLRDNVVIYSGELESLRRFKESVSEVRNGVECGIGVYNYNDVKIKDQIEFYEVVPINKSNQSVIELKY